MNIPVQIPEKRIANILNGAHSRYWCSYLSVDPVSLNVSVGEREPANAYEESDGETGDVLLQLACFGELKYG